VGDRQHPRPADPPPKAGRRLLGRDGRRLLPVPGHLPRHPRLHHPHHHRRHRRRRLHPPAVRRTLGRRRPYRLALGPPPPRPRAPGAPRPSPPTVSAFAGAALVLAPLFVVLVLAIRINRRDIATVE